MKAIIKRILNFLTFKKGVGQRRKDQCIRNLQEITKINAEGKAVKATTEEHSKGINYINKFLNKETKDISKGSKTEEREEVGQNLPTGGGQPPKGRY